MHPQSSNSDSAVAHPPIIPLSNFSQSGAEINSSTKQRQICRIVRQAAWEMYALFSGEPITGRNRRFAMLHIRQIAIYVCHVGLSMPVMEVAICFGRDAATVRASCLQVEEQREQPGFDEFVSAIERLAKHIAATFEGQSDETRN